MNATTTKTFAMMPLVTVSVEAARVTYGGIETRTVTVTHEQGGKAAFEVSSQPSHNYHAMRVVSGRPPRVIVEHLQAWLAIDFPGIVVK